MARIVVEYERPITPPVKEVVLHLTEDEAVLLGALLGRTPSNGSGSLSQSLYNTFESAGLGHSHPDYARVKASLR